jgi:hypothetical protein
MGLLNAIALYILVSIFSSGTETNSRWKVLALALFAGLVPLIVVRLLPGLFGAVVALATVVAVVTMGLMFWCQVERKAALKIGTLFLIVSIALDVAFSAIR